MTDVLAHRGPDDSGYFPSEPHTSGENTVPRPPVSLGHRRLSIIDVGGGHQPLSNEDGRVWVAFNGEIYNYRELRDDLRTRGHLFTTASDTEVIVHAWEEYGPECLQHFRGMFAFALWDDRTQTLLLARDRIGQKPLFYRLISGRLEFASELKALLQIPGVDRTLDRRAVDLFLTYQYVPHPDCILEGYAKLPPAHYGIYRQGRFDIHRYWQAPYAADVRLDSDLDWLAASERWSDADWSRTLRETLTESVRLRMRSDVPIGAFLSGGVDSTIIAGLMQSLSPRPIHTFSIGFPVQSFDERRYAREAAKQLGTEHHEYVVEPSAIDSLPDLIWHYDEPFGDSSAVPQMALCKLTREQVTVALSGDGGDELFCGYERYQAVRLASRFDFLPRPVRKLFAWKLWQRFPASTSQRSFTRRLKRFLAALGQSPERRYLRWIGIFDDELRHELYTADFRDSLGDFDSAGPLLEAFDKAPGRDIVTRTTCADLHTYLPCDILTKVDIASMAASLEARSPFLDHRVAELAARMPLRLKQSATQGKRILIETFRDLLPASIQTRRKMGFGVPINVWFRNELQDLLRGSLLDETARNRGLFNPRVVQRLIDEHTRGAWDHSYRLWNLLCFEHWCRTFLDRDPSAISREARTHR